MACTCPATPESVSCPADRPPRGGGAAAEGAGHPLCQAGHQGGRHARDTGQRALPQTGLSLARHAEGAECSGPVRLPGSRLQPKGVAHQPHISAPQLQSCCCAAALQVFFHDPDRRMIEVCTCHLLPIIPLAGPVTAATDLRRSALAVIRQFADAFPLKLMASKAQYEARAGAGFKALDTPGLLGPQAAPRASRGAPGLLLGAPTARPLAGRGTVAELGSGTGALSGLVEWAALVLGARLTKRSVGTAG